MTDHLSETLIEVDPADLIVGINIRTKTGTDPKAGARQFAASIRARGVLEAITCHRDADGRLVVLRGQRRTLVAAQVGTPTGTVPVRVVDAPVDADRITDQLGENVHREAMTDAEVCGAVEQLALLGVSAAQIAKRVAIPRGRVDAALTVAKASQARERLQQGLTLEDALVFAEFDGDPDAIANLDLAQADGQALVHVAQRLRDNAAERLIIRTEVTRLRELGLPVLEPDDVPESLWRHRLDDLVRADSGERVGESEVAALPTAAIVVDVEYDDYAVDAEDPETSDRLRAASEWIVLDAEAAGLVPSWQWRQQHRGHSEPVADATEVAAAVEAARAAKSAERRTVITNNKAWDSAETVRREWLAAFCTRKTPPAGAEELISTAVLLADDNLSRAMNGGNHLLRSWLGLKSRSWQTPDQLPGYLTEVTSPKRHTMLVLAAVLAAWEDSLTRDAWRQHDPWDERFLTAIIGWGYQPSAVEKLMITSDRPITPEDDGGTPVGTGETDIA